MGGHSLWREHSATLTQICQQGARPLHGGPNAR